MGAVSPDQRRLNLESFDAVWQTVRDRHWDPAFNGVDWPEMRDRYRGEVERAGSTAEARTILTEMLQRLGQSHFAILPAEVYGDLSPGFELPGGVAEPRAPVARHGPAARDSAWGAGSGGFDLRVRNGLALVVAVDRDAPAASLGVRPGWRIAKIDGKRVEPMLVRIAQEYDGSTLYDGMASRAVLGLLAGPVGTTVQVEFLDGAEERVSLSLPRVEPPGKPVRLGHLPTVYVDFRSRRVEPEIGYIAFTAFLDPAVLMQEFAEAIRAFEDTDGLILDLRGNIGGLAAMAMGIGGWFVDRSDRRLGTMTTRETTLKLVLNPRVESYDGLLAILIDGCSMSTAEMLAGGLQDLGRARVFGTRSAGAALPSMIERLPNGDGFQYAFAHYVSVGGRPLEGRGVIPDVHAPPERDALLAGGDPALDAAIDWIRNHKSAESPRAREPLGPRPAESHP